MLLSLKEAVLSGKPFMDVERVQWYANYKDFPRPLNYMDYYHVSKKPGWVYNYFGACLPIKFLDQTDKYILFEGKDEWAKDILERIKNFL